MPQCWFENPRNILGRQGATGVGCFHCNRRHASGHDPLVTSVDLHAEAHINPPHLQEAASERCPGKPGWCQLRKELSTANQDVTAPAVDDLDLLEAVSGPDEQTLHILKKLRLHAVAPRFVGPKIEGRSGGDGLWLRHWVPSTTFLSFLATRPDRPRL
jgi:hypothetical protein